MNMGSCRCPHILGKQSKSNSANEKQGKGKVIWNKSISLLVSAGKIVITVDEL
jgi:hypothetical protein